MGVGAVVVETFPLLAHPVDNADSKLPLTIKLAPSADHIRSCSAINRVGTAATDQSVIAPAPCDDIVADACIDRVVAVSTG